MYISLYGACEELNVHLQPDVVLLKSTYLSLSTVHQVSLTNKSDVPLKYCWTTWPSLQEEALSLLRWPMILHRQPTTMIFIVFSKHELLKPSLFLCMHESSEAFFFFTTTWISRNSPGVTLFVYIFFISLSLFFPLWPSLFLSLFIYLFFCLLLFLLCSLSQGRAQYSSKGRRKRGLGCFFSARLTRQWSLTSRCCPGPCRNAGAKLRRTTAWPSHKAA